MTGRNARRIQLLESELSNENFLKTGVQLPVLTLERLQKSILLSTALEIFDKLGGLQLSIPGDMDYHIQYNGLLIQLDDELHFNRYRKITLESDFYEDYKGFRPMDYRSQSRLMEKECIKSGLSSGNWTYREAEDIFGLSEEPGDLSLERKGAAAWKYRAWRDFLQDLSGKILGFKVLRISVYDKVMLKGRIQPIGNLLESSDRSNYGYIAKSLVRRIINLKGS